MSDLIIDRGLRDKILQPDWEDILGSIVSTTDIEDYGDYAIIDNGGSLIVYSGKRHHVIKNKDLEHYFGERGRRGRKLPRGFQRVDRLDCSTKVT